MSVESEEFEVRKCSNCGRTFESESDFYRQTSRWRICENKFLWFNCSCESTLLIPRGKYDWYSPDKHLNLNASTLFNKLGKNRKIPYVNSTIQKINLMISEDRDLDEIYQEVKKESILSDQIIKIVKNYQIAKNTNTKEYPTLLHSLNYLGKEKIYDFLVLSFLSTIKLETKVFNADKFWNGCNQTGMIACILNNLVKLQYKSEQLFIAGSNCHIGKIVLALYFPEETDKIWKTISEPKTQCSWYEAERKITDFDSRILGEIGGAMWGLSEESLDVIRYTDVIDTHESLKNINLINLVSLASMFQYWISNQPHLIDKNLFKSRLKYFSLNEDDISDYISLNWCY